LDVGHWFSKAAKKNTAIRLKFLKTDKQNTGIKK